jgi:hypothetical protein
MYGEIYGKRRDVAVDGEHQGGKREGQSSVDIDRVDQLVVNTERLNFVLPPNKLRRERSVEFDDPPKFCY